MSSTINKNVKNIICKVDGKSLQASFGESLLQACFKAYIDIPRFCYHEGLQIAGNCRMCLVEVENSRKLVASCATPVVTNLSVFTKTFRVKKARQAVLEFLLINHPLDCPICDQGGECDLQDITLVFGSDRGRFYEMSKRAVIDKNLGPLIKTIMNRCIHCTRCVRFFKEVSIENDYSLLGLLGRGSSTEIGTYIADDLLHELSGNVIDLCPVGALTSKPFAFKARTWELSSQYNFDVVDVMMPRIKMDLSGAQVLRILPYMEEYGYGWVSNKTRFFFDSLNFNRVDSCLWSYDLVFTKFISTLNIKVKQYFLPLYVRISWKDAFFLLFLHILQNITNSINFIVSPSLSLNQAWALKKFALSLGIDNFLSKALLPTFVDFRNFYTIDVSLDFLEDWLWVLVFLGVNLRMEAPLLFLHLKRLYSLGRIVVLSALQTVFFEKKVNNVGLTLNKFIAFLEGRTVYNRMVVKKLFFYKFLFLINVEHSTMSFFQPLKAVFSKIFKELEFGLSNNFFANSGLILNTIIGKQTSTLSFGVLQRYVGNISVNEFALISMSSSYKFFSNFKSRLNLYIDTVCPTTVVKSNTNVDSNILLAQSSYINEIFQNPNFLSFSLIMPFKSVYINTEEVFFDLFMREKSVVNIKPASLNERSFEAILDTFSLYITKTSQLSLLKLLHRININTWQEGLGLHLETQLESKFKGSAFENMLVYLSFYHGKISLNSLYWIGVTPVLNFYEDQKFNLVNVSNTLKRSSLVFQRTKKFYSFGFFFS